MNWPHASERPAALQGEVDGELVPAGRATQPAIVEYVVLTRGELGGWSASDAGGLGRDLAPILNDYASRGWRVVVGRESQLILERPRQAGEVVPVDAPVGRGDELAPAS